ncbi:MAG: ankyrin repeat domain-containing protein [Pedobacter sp.]|nr:MAG: ankyrin repeat domain-containing protein [Pedobacter sp.]
MNALFKMVSDGDLISLKNELNDNNINRLNVSSVNLLQNALKHKQDEIARYLINQGIAINHKDDVGYNALHYLAVYENDISLAELCLQKGADINATDNYGNSALWTAIFYARGNYNYVECLLRNNADVSVVNKSGKTPLDLALLLKFQGLIDLLAKYTR